jgi:hypothetical protein
MYKPKLLVDFDGVIHTYSRGWADGTAYDPPMPGAKMALDALSRAGYEVVIFSTRDWEDIGDWLKKWGFPDYRVTNIKEPAVAQIDDRAIRFESWSQSFEDVLKLYPIAKEDP